MLHESESKSDEALSATPIDILKRWQNELASDATAIQDSLNVKRADMKAGEISFAEWREWHRRAAFALRKKQEALRRVKAAVSSCHRADFDRRTGAMRPHARALLRELRILDLSEFPRIAELALQLAEVVFHPEEYEAYRSHFVDETAAKA